MKVEGQNDTNMGPDEGQDRGTTMHAKDSRETARIAEAEPWRTIRNPVVGDEVTFLKMAKETAGEYVLARDGRTNGAGVPKNPLQLALTYEMGESYLASVPLWLQRGIFGPLAGLARRLGVDRSFDRYLTPDSVPASECLRERSDRSMAEEENRSLLPRFVEEVLNGGNLDVVDELIDPSGVDHAAPPGFPNANAIEREKEVVRMLRSAFPDFHATIEDVIAEGDKVVTRGHWSGTHEGEFMGIPATGRHVTVSEIHIIRCADGKMVEHWHQQDALGM